MHEEGRLTAQQNALACYAKVAAEVRTRWERHQRHNEPDAANALLPVVHALEADLERMRNDIAKKADPGASDAGGADGVVPPMRHPLAARDVAEPPRP